MKYVHEYGMLANRFMAVDEAYKNSISVNQTDAEHTFNLMVLKTAKQELGELMVQLCMEHKVVVSLL